MITKNELKQIEVLQRKLEIINSSTTPLKTKSMKSILTVVEKLIIGLQMDMQA